MGLRALTQAVSLLLWLVSTRGIWKGDKYITLRTQARLSQDLSPEMDCIMAWLEIDLG